MSRLLHINDLWISYFKGNKKGFAIRGVDLTIDYNQIVGIVGESGSGKSTLAHAIVGLLPRNSKVEKGEILFEGKNLIEVRKEDLYKFRGKNGIFMIFQDPMTSLNPTMKISEQLGEIIKNKPSNGTTKNGLFLTPKIIRRGLRKDLVLKDYGELREALKKVGFRNPDETLSKYPHQLSGGERQRIMIAMAYLLKPKVLIADEPTTALDVITQAQVLKMLIELKEEFRTSIMFISHDIALISQISDRIVVMYGGMIMEEGYNEDIVKNPLHPYTKGLISSIPNYFKGEGKISSIPGFPPNIFNLPSGCPFHPRCSLSIQVCKQRIPEDKKVGESHNVRCYLYS